MGNYNFIIALLFTISVFSQETFDNELRIIEEERGEWVLLWSYEIIRNGTLYEERYYIRRDEENLPEPTSIHILCPIKEEENDYRSI